MRETIRFGTHVVTTRLDDGSTKTVETKYHDSKGKTTNYFEIRTKVKDEKEELAEIIRFMKEKKGFKRGTRVEPASGDGSYYLIKCWEE